MSQDIKRKASSELERTSKRMQAKPCTSRGTTPGTPDSVPSSERRAWRDCSTAADFFDNVAKWPSKDKDSFLLQLNHDKNPATTLADQQHSLQICLLDLASRNVQDIQRRLPTDSNIDWDAVFPTGASDESHQDNLITAWIRINRRERNAIRVYQYSLSDIDAFTKALQAVIPLRRRQQRRESHKFASKAFQIEPRTRATDGSLPSQDVFEEVRQYCTQYSDVQYLAPYTSIVGPSGIGKSYAVQSLATRHGLYVSYTSFASKLAYPSRSPVADCFPLDENTGDSEDEYARLAFLKKFFKAFIFLSLEDVLILRRLGVYSKNHFLMQINPDNESEGDDFRNAFKEYVANSWKTFARAQDCEDLALVAHVLQKRQEDLQEILSRSDVKMHDQQGDKLQDRQNDFIVMCIDEARALLQHGTAPFRAFRQALREMWWWLAEQGKGYPRVFGLVLDTTSKISNFSPAPAHDPSQKVASDGSALNLLPPIWMLSSTDLFKSGDSRALFKKANDIRYNMGEVKELFSFGRPLWGAMMSDSSSSAESIRYVLKLAQEKTQGVNSDQLTRYLALLSYRVHFYVHRQEWAERLVSGWMRYITSIADNRELLQTTQPSEPILAYTAARCMQNLTIRSGILGEFSTQVQRGTISVRDTGEIVAALLLLFASDAVQFRDDQMRWPQPMLLSDFTNQLLGLKKAEEITNAVHEEAEAKVSQMWRKGEVFFNHVVRRSERPTEETLRRAYRRGAALLLPHNSPGADILIPVHDPDGNKMSCFIIQVKNRISDAPTKTLRLQASADLAKAATVLSLDCPYLAMMMCLRTSPSTSPGCEILDPQNKQVQTRPATRRLQSSTMGTPAAAKPQKSKKSNRILIITYGLDEAVYPALRHDSEQAPRTVDRLRSLLNCLPMTVVPQNEKHRIYLNGLEGL